MQPLTPPDSFHLSAAIGWLELGNHIEANEELERITAGLRAHPDVLDVRWLIYERAKNWQACLDIANALVQLSPDDANGYIKRSFALRRIEGGGIKAAFEALFESWSKFPHESIIPYNLACYQCQLGNNKQARYWLERAFAIGDSTRLKLMALDDTDLEPLWTEIQGKKN